MVPAQTGKALLPWTEMYQSRGHLGITIGAREMPALLEHIDAIARKLQRDVLYLAFELADR
ncbi:hypothetical protein BZM26_28945 [Paraburkholderia strydomiana]|nr:hypothetical protein BZM26_28945 [Paraburkholderia strydomiana]